MIKRCCVLLAAAALFFTLTCFSGGDEAGETVEALVLGRFETLNRYYMGQAAYSDTAEALYEIESGRLLAEDCGNLITFENSDVECYKSFSVEKLDITSRDESLICAEITMRNEKFSYGMGENESFVTEENVYSIICEMKGDKYKIVQFFYVRGV